MNNKKQDLKNIELIAIDIDGTLLDSKLQVSQKTKDKIRELVDRGVYVTLVSGRTFKATEFIRQRLEVDIPIVAYNGGKVVYSEDEEAFSAKIPLTEAIKIIKYGEERNLYVKVYIDDVLYTKEPDEKSLAFSVSNNIDYKVVGKLSENIHEDVNMIVAYYNEDIHGVIDKKLKDIKVTITTSVSNSIDVIPEGISKDKGLKMIAEHLNVRRDNILAIGNSLNDLDMLRYAGIGIAMKNSDISLLKKWKNISQYTNDEEGVYRIIKDI